MALETTYHTVQVTDDEEDITPGIRYSSSYVIAAAEKLRLRQSSSKRAYHTLAHSMTANELEHEFRTNLDTGLSSAQQEQIRMVYGPNILTPPTETPCWAVTLPKFSFWFLMISLVLSIVMTVEMSAVISAVCSVVLAIALGLLLALVWFTRRVLREHTDRERRLEKQKVTVIRDSEQHRAMARIKLLIDALIRRNNGKYAPLDVTALILHYCDASKQWIDSEQLCVGDVVVLKQGEMAPADMRIVECSDDCRLDNSQLTGESEPQLRNAKVSDEVPAEAMCLVFSGTFLVDGYCKCVVFATGDETFMGRIAPLSVAPRNDDLFTQSVGLCESIWSAIVGILTIVLFSLTVGTAIDLVTFLCLSIANIVIAILGIFSVAMIWGSGHCFLKKITEECKLHIKGCHNLDSSYAEILGLINVLILADDAILNGELLRASMMNIKLMVLTDKDLESAQSMMDDIEGNKNVWFQKWELSQWDSSMQADSFGDTQYKEVANAWKGRDDILVVYGMPQSMYWSVYIVAVLQELGNIVGFVGVKQCDCSAFLKADVSVLSSCHDYNGAAGVKNKADIICFSDPQDALKCIMNAIRASKSYLNSIVYKFRFKKNI